MKLKLTKTQKGTQTKNTKENTLKGKIIYKVQNNGGTQVILRQLLQSGLAVFPSAYYYDLSCFTAFP